MVSIFFSSFQLVSLVRYLFTCGVEQGKGGPGRRPFTCRAWSGPRQATHFRGRLLCCSRGTDRRHQHRGLRRHVGQILVQGVARQKRAVQFSRPRQVPRPPARVRLQDVRWAIDPGHAQI